MCKKIILLLAFLITLIVSNSLVLAQDLNGDGIVNILDLSIVAKAFGSKLGDANWNKVADLDGNGIVDISDVNKVANNYGKGVTSESKPSGISSIFKLSFTSIVSWFKNLFNPAATETPPLTRVYVEPIKIVDKRLNSGKKFTVDINVYDVYFLYCFQFVLKYNPGVLRFDGFNVSNFLNNTIGIVQVSDLKSLNSGDVAIGACSLGNINGRTGSGKLANVTFQVIGEGETSLDSYDIILEGNYKDAYYFMITNFIYESGYFNNKPDMNIQYSIMRPSSGTIV